MAEHTENMRQVIVRMPVEMHDALKRRAEANDRTMAGEARRAIRLYIEGERP